MPSIITHHYFALDVLKNLDKDISNKFINSELIYTTFAQSHDYLYYYFGNEKIKKIGRRGHHENTQDYLINIIKYIKKNKLEKNSDLLAYLYGSITHYFLDSTCHPYIFYKTGIYRKNEPETKKYNGEHTHIEKDLDAIYYELNTHKKYNHCNINKDIIKNPIFSQELTDCLNYVYKETYNEDNIGIYYYKSIKKCKLINTFIINDYFGIKRSIYLLIDKITHHKFGYISSYSTHILNPNLEFLNLKNKEWNHPSNKDIKYSSSFPELYEIAFNKTTKAITIINNYFEGKENIDFIYKILPNIDYSTGMLIEENLRMQYFEEHKMK